MRPSWALAALLLASVLAGCTSDTDPAADAGEAVPGEPQPFLPGGSASDQPRMRFASPEYSEALPYEGAFNSAGCNPILAACPGHEVRFDLTAQVPADAPVELAATVESDSPCMSLNIDLVDTALQSLSIEDGELAATLVRKATGTVTLVALQCNGLNGFTQASGTTPVTADVRTVVRPDVLPPYMPVLVRLVPGDRILAMGDSADSIQDLVVIPPGRPPIHHVTDPQFNVTPDMPAGDYILVVKGAEAMLHGPNVTLTPAAIQHYVGEQRELPSGSTLSWTTPAPGIPAFAAMVLVTGSNQGLTDPGLHFMGDYRMAILQGGNELAMHQQGCGIPCSFNGPGGFMSTSIGTGFFPEELGLGELAFEVENSMSQGSYAFEVIGYIALP